MSPGRQALLSAILLQQNVFGELDSGEDGCANADTEYILTERSHHELSLDASFLQVTTNLTNKLSQPATASFSLLAARADHTCKDDTDCAWHASCNTGSCQALTLGQGLKADILMSVLAFIISGAALAAGIGGGGIFVPTLMLVLSMDGNVASALSQAMLCGGAFAAFVCNLNSRHPSKHTRPLVNFELAALLGAPLMAGAQLGSVIHAYAPPALTLAVLVVTLIDSFRSALASALKMSAKELEKEKEGSLEKVTEGSVAEEQDPHSTVIWERNAAARLNLGCVWVVCMVLVFCKGQLVPICSAQWWVLTFGTSALLGSWGWYYAGHLSSKEPLDEHDLDFKQMSHSLFSRSLFAGVLSAVCGIGGGMVMGPILVRMKIPPPVSSATTATTLLVLSSSTLLVYLCRGSAPTGYSICLSLCTLCGATIGKTCVAWFVHRTGKQSTIVWLLAALLAISLALAGIMGIASVLADKSAALALIHFCQASDDIASIAATD
eukprot:TRINITY_DN11592_c0_g1_i1.p1 TRINITY_DN11592_c0_g1~~TRINITY_DN11592_c0_g1_i1.p1  ORF type:complete len:495 (-),score=84.26 TRINITY_DN11592_c0_g1_i1:10-1494(-)